MKIEIEFELYIFFDRLIIWMISSKHIQRTFRKYTTDVYLVKRYDKPLIWVILNCHVASEYW